MERWKKEMLWCTIIYRVLECDDKIPLLTMSTDYSFAESALNEMNAADLIEPRDGSEYWHITDKGRQLRSQMLAIYDQALKFEIFNTVHLAMQLGDDVTADDGGLMDHCYDPRFDPDLAKSKEDQEKFGTEDMRIAMMEFLTDSMVKTGDLKESLDPHRIVFIQKLAEGKLRDKNIWFDLALGKFYREVEDIVSSQYKWTDVADDVGESEEVMKVLYTAGMLEQRKRDGHECSSCNIPLSVFEMNAQEDGKELTHCPNPDCGADFNPPKPEGEDEYECPNCETTIWRTQRSCATCGVLLDFSLPPGTMQTETVTETVVEEDDYFDDDLVIWGGYYDYSPYGYYDPWDPWVDVAAFGVCCAILL